MPVILATPPATDFDLGDVVALIARLLGPQWTDDAKAENGEYRLAHVSGMFVELSSSHGAMPGDPDTITLDIVIGKHGSDTVLVADCPGTPLLAAATAVAAEITAMRTKFVAECATDGVVLDPATGRLVSCSCH